MEKRNKSSNLKKFYFPIYYSFFLLIIINLSVNSLENDRYIYFPLKKRDNTKLENLKNITDIMKFIYLEPLIIELNIGIPEQKASIIFRTDCSYMYITSYNHNTSKYSRTSDLIQLKYGNFSYYNEEISTSVNNYDKNFNFYGYAYDNQFFSSCISETININDKKRNFDLMLSKQIELEEPGAFCLQLEEASSVLHFTPSFPILLKNNYSLIDNFKWFIYYGQNNNEKDYLVIGTSVDEFINPETGKKIYPNFDEKDYFNDNDQIRLNKAEMIIKFNDIYLSTGTNQKENFEDSEHFKGKLIPNIGFIVGTLNYSQYLENNIFGKYLELGQCYKSNFIERPNLVGENYSYYYCEESLYNNIKNIFKDIVFKQVSLSEEFVLTFDDLFIKQNGYLIFLVIFSTHQHNFWDLGTPFLRKYQFDFDFKNTLIGYYRGKNKKEDKEPNNKSINWILFYIEIIVFILLIALGVFLIKKFYKNRKKRANELDDDYEYHEKKNGDNLVINGGNKIFE